MTIITYIIIPFSAPLFNEHFSLTFRPKVGYYDHFPVFSGTLIIGYDKQALG